jgi:8-oxo-dGTP pyrophosphatase MutT (NUDIX family)
MGWLIAAIIVVLLLCAFRLARLATRLDRLHRRTEAAWAALDVALARRLGVARALVANAELPGDVSVAISGAGRQIESASRTERADAENALTKALELLPPAPDSAIGAELNDVAQRVLLARRFYNDAVRDTRSLRSNRFSRMFRLAGRAELPQYFEIAEYNPATPLTRVSARVLLFDDADRVLLHAGFDPNASPREHWWFTPGGGVEQGEDLVTAAQRELAEETGLVLATAELAGPLWWRREQFRFAGIDYDQTEYYFVASVPGSAVLSSAGFTELERASITQTRWWTPADLKSTEDLVYPVELPSRLPEALATARLGWTAKDPSQIS